MHKDNIYQVDFKNNVILSCGTDRRIGVVKNEEQNFLQKDFLIYTCALSPSGEFAVYSDNEAGVSEVFSTSDFKPVKTFNNENLMSDVLILAKEEYINDLKKAISEIPFCSVELCENEKIIVVIESENLEDELNSYKMLEKLPNIISINMVFSYQDLNDDIQKAINSGAIETIEKNENAENVRYYGSVFNQFS
ncbi:hypothetical protein EHI_052300 [Entamoeba histolytica HM-1:IMSS]|uniref:Uncharacterized protein n=2 Tax=cellular organisms TaxID=131567 RepID=B1N5W4_ENTH1|nr:hypothetical protein EHI_052300 [Entamoeba histolytica HM-1:IMSS]EDS88644.1 hypothetical protein EHI_052300 [Entamoeba histolytica HM-1:IMSS]|eukprot:XP_001914580.1 hypothetical protein EHI_052300 [Entamoeba histolytica HM-1:IMSS]